MAAYILLNKVSVPTFAAGQPTPPTVDSPIIPIVIAPNQTFQLTVQGDSGAAISATVQVVVSNDDGMVKNWFNYGDKVTVSGTTLVTTGFGGSQNWKYFAAYLPAISGTNAKATLVMNG